MSEDLFQQPIDNRLNLEAFRPDEVMFLISDYLAECRKQGLTEVRLVHRRDPFGHMLATIHERLEQTRGVVSYHPTEIDSGGWPNETMVVLAP